MAPATNRPSATSAASEQAGSSNEDREEVAGQQPAGETQDTTAAQEDSERDGNPGRVLQRIGRVALVMVGAVALVVGGAGQAWAETSPGRGGGQGAGPAVATIAHSSGGSEWATSSPHLVEANGLDPAEVWWQPDDERRWRLFEEHVEAREGVSAERTHLAWALMPSSWLDLLERSVEGELGEEGETGHTHPHPQEPAEEATGSRAQQGGGAIHQRGEASWYGAAFAGRPTASGEAFDPGAMTAAHRDLPLGSVVLVVAEDGRSVVVRINDRGPFRSGSNGASAHPSRVIDLSKAAAQQIGAVESGVVEVSLQVLSRP